MYQNSNYGNYPASDMKPPTGIPVTMSSSNQYYTSADSLSQPPPPPPPLPLRSRPRQPWSTGLCDCGTDVKNCCITCFCPCVTFGQIAEIVDKGSSSCGATGALYALIALVTGCGCLYSCFYRSKMRQQYALKDSPCGDCLVHCCCEYCALCQEYRELQYRGYNMSIGWHGNVEEKNREFAMGPTAPAVEEEPGGGSPHEALFFVLPYLPVFELISMSQVCVCLKDAVKNDILPWLNIIVQKPLKLSRFSDELLLQITNMAHGRLRTLALINCSKITDDGLQRVIDQNPLIDKLYIPACSGLTPEGVIRAVKTLSKHDHNLKTLWINGIYNVTKEHLETLHNYLQMDMPPNKQKRKQRLLFHEYGNITLTRYDNDFQPMLDLQICPICEEMRVVFDCPRKTYEMMIEKSLSDVRGCKICVPWCKECGKWVGPLELEEAVCLDVLCLDCWLHLPKCDFCNKPYCKEHANERQHQSLGSNGNFVCDVCHIKFIESFIYNIED